jgi:hypothetical protein
MRPKSRRRRLLASSLLASDVSNMRYGWGWERIPHGRGIFEVDIGLAVDTVRRIVRLSFVLTTDLTDKGANSGQSLASCLKSRYSA